MKFLTILVFLIEFCLVFQISYCSTYISELKFAGNEYIEVFSDIYLNFSGSKIYSNDDGNYNTINIIKTNNNSNIFIIGGKKFFDNYNLSELNCNLYQTDRSQVIYGGFDIYGNNFTIALNNTYNITWTNNLNIIGNETMSINYNNKTHQYVKLNLNPCKVANFNFSDNIHTINRTNYTQKINNNSQKTSNHSLNNCNLFFNIITNDEIFEDKITFNFVTNYTDYEIEYWIEDYSGKVTKNKMITMNTNSKSYTPTKKTQIYTIFANISNNNCSKFENKTVIFYNELEETSDKNYLEIGENNTNIINKESFIKIENKEKISERLTNFIEYLIYRGDTSKSAVSIYFDSKKTQTFYPKKYASIEGRVYFDNDDIREIYIEGLGVSKRIYIKEDNRSEVNKINYTINNDIENSFNESYEDKENKEYFNVNNIIQYKDNINFNVKSSIQNLSYHCYILIDKTKVSDIINKTSSANLTILVNKTQIIEKSGDKNVLLKLICKYKKQYLKTFKYSTNIFNYSAIDSKWTENEEIINKTQIPISSYNTDLNEFSYFNMPVNNEKNNFSKKELLLINNDNISKYDNPYANNITKNIQINNITPIFKSSNSILKENSYFFIFIGVSLITIILILKR